MKVELFLILSIVSSALGFRPISTPTPKISSTTLIPSKSFKDTGRSKTLQHIRPLHSIDPDSDTEYQQRLRLRAEVESPFSGVRRFTYISFIISGFIGLLFTTSSLAASLSGIAGSSSIQELGGNFAIDLGAIILSGILLKRDVDTGNKRLQRIATGGKLAGLKVLLQGEDDRGIVTLADLRRGRGREKRAVILVGSLEVLSKSLEAASQISEQLVQSDLLIIPYLVKEKKPLTIGIEKASDIGEIEELPTTAQGPHVAIPTMGSAWSSYIGEEIERATEQGIDARNDGICIVIKKNGKIGQRTKGVPSWLNLVGDVDSRKARGLDTSNI